LVLLVESIKLPQLDEVLRGSIEAAPGLLQINDKELH
jgi:hypothetical protein